MRCFNSHTLERSTGTRRRKFKWKIIEDGGVVTVGTPPAKNTFDVDDTDIDFDQPIKDVFFKYMFANIEGHARLMHDYHSDKRSSNYDTYKDCGFTMMDLTSDDEDSQIKICYLLMAAAATEVERGVDNLFKKGLNWGPEDLVWRTGWGGGPGLVSSSL